MDIYPLKFRPIYKETIWGGRNLQRLFGRALPDDKTIGESWELADLPAGVSVVADGPLAGTTLTDLTRRMGPDLLGDVLPTAEGRFPLLLKFLDATDILSLQVHPDAQAAAEIPGAAMKTECWYVVESRGGFIYKGVKPGVTPEDFRRAMQADRLADVVQRYDVAAGDFHYLPAGTVHALGAGVVVAEVQTPSDTTYRVTDWGRGREIHVDRAMQCIRFDASCEPPGAKGSRLLAADAFIVSLGQAQPERDYDLIDQALMILSGWGLIRYGRGSAVVEFAAGDTILLPAGLAEATMRPGEPSQFLAVALNPPQEES